MMKHWSSPDMTTCDILPRSCPLPDRADRQARLDEVSSKLENNAVVQLVDRTGPVNKPVSCLQMVTGLVVAPWLWRVSVEACLGRSRPSTLTGLAGGPARLLQQSIELDPS